MDIVGALMSPGWMLWPTRKTSSLGYCLDMYCFYELEQSIHELTLGKGVDNE